jgi:DNA-binding PadR family transcriptional regulator
VVDIMDILNIRQRIILNLLIANTRKPMSPIQIMKALFLYSQEEKPQSFYEFIPYLYGPCSFDVYSDLNLLESRGFIATYPTYRGWNFYGITSEGEKYSITDTIITQKLDETKKLIQSKSFIELLKYIYSKYPGFATNSIFSSEVLKKL